MQERAMASITFLPGLMVLIFGFLHLSDGFQIQALRTARNCAHHKPSASVNNDSDVPAESTLDVIKKCMGQSVPSQTTDAPVFLQMRPGISGFAVDPELGFVAVLTKGGKSTSVVVSAEDTLEVRSSEGLCLVQLAGGMDLGTGILPPDSLAQLVADELEVSKEDIRPKLQLLEVRAVLNKDMLPAGSSSRDAASEVPPSTPERDFKLEANVVKLLASVKKLPGLGRCSKDQVMDAMKVHADADGAIDRTSFMDILHTLRLKNVSSGDASRIRFEMVISLDNKKKESVSARSSLLALGLAMRYGIEVQVSDECLEYDALDIASKFPKFRPMQELEEDAKLMEGFIPSMYSKVAGSLKADDRAT